MVANDCSFNAFVHGEHIDILTSWWCNLNLPASSRFAFTTNYYIKIATVSGNVWQLSSLPPPVFWISSHINKVSSRVRGTKKVIKETELRTVLLMTALTCSSGGGGPSDGECCDQRDLDQPQHVNCNSPATTYKLIPPLTSRTPI